MGFKEITFKLPTDFVEDQLRKRISKKLRIRKFTFQIENKSLDARNKNNIHWLVRIIVSSKEIKGEDYKDKNILNIPYKKRKSKILIVGSGPAGFFSAFVLQKAGFQTSIIERGSDVEKRNQVIQKFETTGVFDPDSNYAFGEGGAGTFSDGKLTSRSKHISKEKKFILSSYINASAPKEIAYMAHPHLGSDNLKIIVKNLRKEYQDLGGTFLFGTQLNNLKITQNRVLEAETNNGNIEADHFIIATGHSAYETFRMLLKVGVLFRTKNFAMGCRMEHPQVLINEAQWGIGQLPGVKAAEYRLHSKGDGSHQVYSFCMCPGGIIVPATAYPKQNIVNGMSNYQRDMTFANSACVAGVHPDELLGKETSPLEILEYIENLEHQFYNLTKDYKAPACSIQEFLSSKKMGFDISSSYPFGLQQTDLWNLLPERIVTALRPGLIDFNNKMKDFEKGNLIGLESKTSSPIQVLREKGGRCTSFQNLYMVGEGSGYTGGIISSAADGIKTALSILESF